MRLLGRNWRKKLAAVISVFAMMTIFSYMAHIHSRPQRLSHQGVLHVQQTNLRVIVVEEHHEVLPYWIHAAEEKVIPMRNNLVIHIDGHSDLGMPNYLPEMPLFKWPETKQQLRSLLQANDVFISDAAMIGLVSRFVWIYPAWDTTVLKNDRKYSRREIQIGIVDDGTGETTPYFCGCIVDETGTKLCQSVLDEEEEDTGGDDHGDGDDHGGGDDAKREGVNIEEICSIRRVLVSEFVHEDLAKNMLNDPKWIPADSSIILDIDEDYFGCELAGNPLVEVGIPWEDVDEMDALIGQLFCPSTVLEEDKADTILKDLIVVYHKACTWDSQLEKCLTSTGQLLLETLKRFRELREKEPSIFCPPQPQDPQLETAWERFLGRLKLLSEDQLQTLLDIGFCFTTGPITYSFQARQTGNFEVCHGDNTPDGYVVFLHSPSVEDIKLRADQLAELFQTRALSNPKLVTVARSVRDGYTPRHFAMDIEDYVLEDLQYSQLPRKVDIEYDESLLGGRRGWSNRREHSAVLGT